MSSQNWGLGNAATYNWRRWATLQAIAGYGCIDPSGMVAPLSVWISASILVTPNDRF